MASQPVLSSTGRLLLPSPGFVPRHYDLHYTSIDLTRHTFTGTVRIDLEHVPNAPTATETGQRQPKDPPPAFLGLADAIALHAVEIDILRATFQHDGVAPRDNDADGPAPAPARTPAVVDAFEHRYSTPTQTCTLLFPSGTVQRPEGAAGRATLTLTFAGILNPLMHGLYRSTYVSQFDPTGTPLTIATTQFEPTDARRAFPCFDEPALKATFRLRVTMDVDASRPGLEVKSNTEVVEVTTHVDDSAAGGNKLLKRTYAFAPTPRMSTYLVALIVSEFDSISSTPATGPTAGITTTVYAVPGRARQGKFCLDVAVQALELYADMLKVPYPLRKSDLVAVPDFAAGAMENWGLVTYREAKILVKDGSTSESTRRGIARTVCHELAHMWFGNLVTPEFWTQLWLKEGVARYMEFVALDKIFPEWDVWTEFTQGVYGQALSLDAMQSSHPVEVEVTNSDEIGEIFDSISYAKGASVVRMISSYVGMDAFLEGMRLFLERHQYGNATSVMFWQALEEASGLNVVELALPWTLQTGYPLVQLVEDSIETPRYLAGGPGSSDCDATSTSEVDTDTTDTVWPIPVTVLVEGEEIIQGPFHINGRHSGGDESDVLLTKISEWSNAGKWFKLNANQAGFYRVAYTKEQWQRLSEVMSPSGPLSAVDRLGLISDSFAAGRAGYASIVDSLRLVQTFGLHEEAEYAVWQELSENLAGLASLYRSTEFFPQFQRYLSNVYSSAHARLGWDAQPDESQRTGTLRGTVINMMGIAGDEAVCAEAFRRFRLYADNPDANPIPGDQQGVIFRTALRHDEESVHTELVRIYEKSTFPEEQRNCLSVMGRVKNTKRHAEMMDYALFSGKVRYQDIAFILNGLSTATDAGGRVCWERLKNDFDSIAAKYSQSHVVWGALVGLICRGLKTTEEADEVEKFFEKPNHPPGSAKRRLSQALEAVRTKAVRLERDLVPVSDFLLSVPE